MDAKRAMLPRSGSHCTFDFNVFEMYRGYEAEDEYIQEEGVFVEHGPSAEYRPEQECMACGEVVPGDQFPAPTSQKDASTRPTCAHLASNNISKSSRAGGLCVAHRKIAMWCWTMTKTSKMGNWRGVSSVPALLISFTGRRMHTSLSPRYDSTLFKKSVEADEDFHYCLWGSCSSGQTH